MEWDQAKIDAAVSTLTEALGTICDVSVEREWGIKEIEPVDGWRNYAKDTKGNKTTITITPREE